MKTKPKTEYPFYSGNDLGWHNGTAKVWAPSAQKVEVLLFRDQSAVDSGNHFQTTAAFADETSGVWAAPVPAETFYCWQIDGRQVCDIYAEAASADSVAAFAAELSDIPWKEKEYQNPFAPADSSVSRSATEAFVYEIHVRDWSRAFVPDSTGKFSDIAESMPRFAEHLHKLGVTHVQLLPSFDYAEKNADPAYNWGYNPYHFFVPEGRYVKDAGKNPLDGPAQFRNMVAAFHEAGIAVVMDVVFNHTSGTGSNSLFDLTEPGYYYRLKDDGSYYNGSGCGNETDSSAPMFRKYMIDCLKHWMKEYHVNGFRFDLMGVHEVSTMAEIRGELAEIDPSVLVYGEPWCGGECGVTDGVDKGAIDRCQGVGCFNDDFRNAVKGPEFGGFGLGQVQGAFNDDMICRCLCGSSHFTQNPACSINYVECHDNYTLSDKLSLSLGGLQNGFKTFEQFSPQEQQLLKAQNKLSAAFVFLAQGMPFVNGGQEFMRTKQGDENSYASSDAVNQIDMSFVSRYEDVFKVYCGLSALRQKSTAFTHGRNLFARTACALPEAQPVAGFVEYGTSDQENEYLVFFNATDSALEPARPLEGFCRLDVTSGEVKEMALSENLGMIGAHSFAVFRRKNVSVTSSVFFSRTYVCQQV